jgi:hypothetical protein
MQRARGGALLTVRVYFYYRNVVLFRSQQVPSSANQKSSSPAAPAPPPPPPSSKKFKTLTAALVPVILQQSRVDIESIISAHVVRVPSPRRRPKELLQRGRACPMRPSSHSRRDLRRGRSIVFVADGRSCSSSRRTQLKRQGCSCIHVRCCGLHVTLQCPLHFPAADLTFPQCHFTMGTAGAWRNQPERIRGKCFCLLDMSHGASQLLRHSSSVRLSMALKQHLSSFSPYHLRRLHPQSLPLLHL